MHDLAELKRAAVAEIDAAADDLIAFGDDGFAHAEPQFEQRRIAALVAERFRDLGLDYRDGLAITGVEAIPEAGRGR